MSDPVVAQKSGLFKIVAAIDAGVFQVERAVVTLSALVMTTTVFLDIVYRAFASDKSKLAEKLLTPLGWFGVERNEANYGFLRDWVSPAVLLLVTFFAGWAVYVAGRRREELDRKTSVGIAWGAGFVLIAYSFVQLLLRVPSKWVCASILLAGCAWWIFDSARNKHWFNAALAAAIGVLGFLVCRTLPQNYIWSQELSLILLAWMAFVGGSMATRSVKHIQVDALGRVVPKALRPWTRALGMAFAAVFAGYVTALAYEHVFGVKGDYNSGETRPATGMPGWVIIFSVVVSFGVTTLRFAGQAIEATLNPRVPEQELSH